MGGEAVAALGSPFLAAQVTQPTGEQDQSPDGKWGHALRVVEGGAVHADERTWSKFPGEA
jgi:hypothetical protein